MSEVRATYRFGRSEVRAALFGLRLGQLGPLAAALGAAVAVIASTPAGVALPVAVALVISAATFVFVPVGGATPQQWIPIVAGYGGRVVEGSRRSSQVPAQPHSRPPGAFSALQIVDTAEDDPLSPGAIVDRRSATWTGVLSLRPENLALLSPAERERIAQCWSRVLSASATGSQLVRLQWIDRMVPDRADALRAALGHPVRDDENDPMLRARRSYEALIARSAGGAMRHECFLAVSVRGAYRRTRPTRSTSPGLALRRELEALHARCRDVGLVVEATLGSAALTALLGSYFALLPSSRTRWPWPITAEEQWSQVRADALVHASYWVADWPQSEVHSDFLLPFLLASERRTISITVAPVSATRAVHEAEQARTSNRADDVLRTNHGFALTARSRRDHEVVLQREKELAEGHRAFRFSGYLSVAAPDEEMLERATQRVEQSSALARLEVRRLYGRQLEGLLATLPIGRGCR